MMVNMVTQCLSCDYQACVIQFPRGLNALRAMKNVCEAFGRPSLIGAITYYT